MNDIQQYRAAADTIKAAILQSQYRATKLITGEQLSLYFGIGCYISTYSRKEAWGTGAINRISEHLRKELPGLRGFSGQNIRNMRTFAEFWLPFLICSPMASKLTTHSIISIDNLTPQNWSPAASKIDREEFLGISFSHHMEILHKTRNIDEVIFYIRETFRHKWDKYELRDRLKANLYQPHGCRHLQNCGRHGYKTPQLAS